MVDMMSDGIADMPAINARLSAKWAAIKWTKDAISEAVHSGMMSVRMATDRDMSRARLAADWVKSQGYAMTDNTDHIDISW